MTSIDISFSAQQFWGTRCMGMSMRATKAFEGNICWCIFVPIQYVNTKSLGDQWWWWMLVWRAHKPVISLHITSPWACLFPNVIFPALLIKKKKRLKSNLYSKEPTSVTPLIKSHSFIQRLTYQKWRTVYSWLLIGLNPYERMWINQSVHTFGLFAVICSEYYAHK